MLSDKICPLMSRDEMNKSYKQANMIACETEDRNGKYNIELHMMWVFGLHFCTTNEWQKHLLGVSTDVVISRTLFQISGFLYFTPGRGNSYILYVISEFCSLSWETRSLSAQSTQKIAKYLCIQLVILLLFLSACCW